jgi:hypothetical protein
MKLHFLVPHEVPAPKLVSLDRGVLLVHETRYQEAEATPLLGSVRGLMAMSWRLLARGR